MPQDSLRSGVYRSFVTCDDPKGVVDCGTIRKSKSNPKRLEDEVKIRTTKNPNSSASTYKEEGKERDSRNINRKDSHNTSSFQLMEVSREAQKLTNVLDTWSSGHSKEIAKDLLKGALDLQESLVMLGKLQDASQYMAKLKKKQKEKSREDTFDDEQIFQRTNSDWWGEDGYEVGFQKPRVSVHGASRDCFEELRTVIRDSLARQNLLPPGSDDEKAFFRDKRTIDSTTDIASTSSSQSSMIQFPNFSSSDISVSSKSPLKPKGPSLIAKLMGLEAIPSKFVSDAPQNKLSGDSRPVFEVDMPMKLKHQSVANKVDVEKRTLDQIVENMKSKGVLSSNFGEGFQFQSHHSTASYCRMIRHSEHDPPVVVIKPIRYSSFKEVDPHRKIFSRDVKDGKHHKPAMYQRDSALSSSETRSEKRNQKGDRNRSGVRVKPEDMVVKNSGKTSSVKLKSSLPVNQQQRRKTVDEKKVDVIHKVKPVRKKQGEVENLKSENVTRPEDRSKLNCPEERKMKMGSKITKNGASIQKHTSSNRMPEGTVASPVTHSTGDRTKKLKKEKPVKEALRDDLVVVNSRPNFIDKLSDAIDPSGENESGMAQTSARTTDELLTDVRIEDQTNYCQDSPFKVPRTQQRTCIIEGGKDCISHGCPMTDRIRTRTRTEAEDLLWSNQSFISHAEMLFDVSSNQAIVPQTSVITDMKKGDLSLLLDCANELVLQKHLRCEQTRHPLLLNTLRSASISISLNHLVEEVCNEIEKLKSYTENAGEKVRMDGVYAVLESDLRSGAQPRGTWDLGWRYGFAADEVEQVVGEIEKLVFSELIEEIVTEDVL